MVLPIPEDPLLALRQAIRSKVDIPYTIFSTPTPSLLAATHILLSPTLSFPKRTQTRYLNAENHVYSLEAVYLAWRLKDVAGADYMRQARENGLVGFVSVNERQDVVDWLEGRIENSNKIMPLAESSPLEAVNNNINIEGDQYNIKNYYNIFRSPQDSPLNCYVYYRIYCPNNLRVAVKGPDVEYVGRIDLYNNGPNDRTARHIKNRIMEKESCGPIESLILFRTGTEPIDENYSAWEFGDSLDVTLCRSTKPHQETIAPPSEPHAPIKLHYRRFDEHRNLVPSKTSFIPSVVNLGRVNVDSPVSNVGIRQRIADVEGVDVRSILDLYTHNGNWERIRDDFKECSPGSEMTIDVVIGSKAELEPSGWFARAKMRFRWKSKR